FVRKVDAGPVVRHESERGIDADPVPAIDVAEIVEPLVDGVEPRLDGSAERAVDVQSCRPGAFLVERQVAVDETMRPRPLGHPVDHAAAAAAAEDHRIRTLQHLDPLEIVEAAIILDVVAKPVDEEVGGAAIAAQEDLVAIAFAERDRGAGYGAEEVADRAQAL